jgi:hypothetical protein
MTCENINQIKNGHQSAEDSFARSAIIHDLVVRSMVLACEAFERGLKAADLTGKVTFDAYKRKAQQKLDAAVKSPSLTVLAQQSRLKKKSGSKS